MPAIRQGLWLAGGLGYGSAEFPSGDAIGGTTANLEAGWTLSRRVLLGVGTSALTRGFGRFGATFGSVDLRMRWYPREDTGGFFFSGGFGLGYIQLYDREASPESQISWGRAFRFGAGYDFGISPDLSITPFGSGSAINTTKDGDHMSVGVWQLGLQLTVH